MKATLEKFLSSFVTTLVLLLIYAFALAIATFIEKYHGTLAAKSMIYYSPVFFLLQFLLVVNFIAIVIRHNYLNRGKWGLMVTHVAFIVILSGAMISFLFGEEGMVHIREGGSTDQLMIQTSQTTTKSKTLPFQLELINFNLHRYPGSSSPSSYESELRVHVDGKTFEEKIFMNNVLDIKGYRFFQASFDRDEKGTILSVNRDVYGRNVTYTGYFLLLVGFVFSFLGKNSRFRQLGRLLKDLKPVSNVVLAFLLMCFATVSHAAEKDIDTQPMMEAVQKYAAPLEHAALFGSLPMQGANGRMIPVNTFSSEILRKLHKNETVGALNSDQFLLSIMALPDMWSRIPFIALSSKELAHHFDLTEKECAYNEMFDSNGNYKLAEMVETAYNKKPSERNAFDKDLMKLDEQVNIIHQLFNYQLLNLFPKEDDPDHKWYAPGDDLSAFSGKDSMFVSQILEWYLSEVQNGMQSGDWEKADEVIEMISTYQHAKNTSLDIRPEKIQREIEYNKLKIFQTCKKVYLILGGLLLIVAFISLSKKSKLLKILLWVLGAGVLIGFHYHMIGMGMRWYIGGYAPWSNSYETMVYVSWATVCAGLLFIRRSAVTFALATLFGGIILFVSGLNWMDPQIGTLVPVLKSPWLMFHVAVIVAAYGFFGISFFIGVTNLVFMSLLSEKNKQTFLLKIKELSIINEMSLWIGLALMTIGTFLGAIWANESWGRYWGWDPKETWALITVVVYAIVTHMRLVDKLNNSWVFNVGSVLAFASVLMTFFGVNYFLSGMHSYGENSDVHGIFIYLYAVAGIVLLLSLTAYRGYKKLSNK